MKRIMLLKKIGFLVVLSAAAPECFSQNMLIAEGEYNVFKPDFWSYSAGFNMQIFNEHVQNDFLLAFGSMTLEDTERAKAIPSNFLIRYKDKFYFSYDFRYIGLRAGVSASLGVYDMLKFPELDIFFNTAIFAGLSLFPKAFIAVTIDVSPGYALIFHTTDKTAAWTPHSGFMMPLSIGLRFNFDKL